jgi:hypothetical protein
MSGQTGSVTVIGGSGFFTQLVYNSEGVLYGISTKLCIVNSATGDALIVGDLKLPDSTNSILMSGAEFSPLGVLYVVENGGGKRVFTVNVNTALLTEVGVPNIVTRDIAIDTHGTIYAGSVDLAILNSSFQLTSLIGSGIFIGGPMFFSKNGTLLKVDCFPSTNVYEISIGTGRETPLFSTGSTGIVALVEEKQAPKASINAFKQNSGYRIWTPDRKELENMEKAYKNTVSQIKP